MSHDRDPAATTLVDECDKRLRSKVSELHHIHSSAGGLFNCQRRFGGQT
jgi:hypothetical protein